MWILIMIIIVRCHVTCPGLNCFLMRHEPSILLLPQQSEVNILYTPENGAVKWLRAYLRNKIKPGFETRFWYSLSV